MEILIQLAWLLLQFLAELFLQIFLEIVVAIIGRKVKAPYHRPERVSAELAALGYALCGAVVGGLSLWLFPALFITGPWLRIANLLLTPILAGLFMGGLGAWRRRHARETIRLDSFAYGFLFAAAMTLVRYVWGD